MVVTLSVLNTGSENTLLYEVKSRSNATGSIKPNIWQTSKIIILGFFSMSISNLPVFFQSEKRCHLETVLFLTSTSPLPPSNTLFDFLWICPKLLFDLFFLVKSLGISLYWINWKSLNKVSWRSQMSNNSFKNFEKCVFFKKNLVFFELLVLKKRLTCQIKALSKLYIVN